MKRKPRIQCTCQTCGKIFLCLESQIKNGEGKFCSHHCYWQSLYSNDHWETNPCENCGNPVSRLRSRRNSTDGYFCSKRCAYDFIAKQNDETRICITCGKEFSIPKVSNQTHCSLQCAHRDKAVRAKMAESFTPNREAMQRMVETKRLPLSRLAFSQRMKANWQNPEFRAKTMQAIEKRSKNPDWYNAPHFQRGENHPKYTGNRKEREVAVQRYDYRQWRTAIYTRDNYTCQHCGSKKHLNAHHIERWVDNPERRYDLLNGVTLCDDCHWKVHGKAPDTRECSFCKVHFILHKRNQKYCSHDCANKARRCPRVSGV